MPEVVRVFIDFWNLQLEWNKKTHNVYGHKKRLDWAHFPDVVVQEVMKTATIDDFRFHGTRVYAGLDATNEYDKRAKNWLINFIDRLPGFNVHLRERRSHPRPVHCKACDSEIIACPSCGVPFSRADEKGVDAAIVTDLLSLAWENAYTVAVLVSSDSDYIPAVERLQEKGFKAINVTWHKLGLQLARTCWSSIELNPLIPRLIRPDKET